MTENDGSIVESNDFIKLMNSWTIPRLAGSPGSYKIVELVKEDFKTFDFQFTEQTFSVFKSDTSFRQPWKFLVMAILFSGFLLLFWFAFWWSLLAILFIGIYATRLKKFPRCSEICSKRIEKISNSEEKVGFKQSNLIYRKKPKKERKCSILLLAHHDSKSQTFPTMIRVYTAFTLVIVFLIIAVLYVFCVVLEIFGITQHLWLRPLTFILGWVNVAVFLILSANRISNKSLGALDDASGIYVLWKTAKLLENVSLENCEVWLVITGAEEIGQIGAADFIIKFKAELDPKTTFAINFEMIGLKNNPLSAIKSYSFPYKHQISPFLFPLTKKLSYELEIDLKGWYLPIGAHTDGHLFRKEGFKAIDFVVKKAGKYTHLPKDTFDLIDPKLINDQARVNVALIQELDKIF
ncbi:MAG: M28 family peptidase [Candidatus Lokiarchaeota archaeon]|nr:M28 family peptidase [Candidatus Lokiarchaeota archaeon]